MEKKEEMKKWMILILFAIISFYIINHLDVLSNIISTVVHVLFPFILGGILAFIQNIPMKKIEKLLKKYIKNPKIPIRTLSILLSLIIILLIFSFVAFLLIPELIQNLEVLINTIPSLIKNSQDWILDLLNQYPDLQIQIQELFIENNDLNTIIANILNYMVNGAIGFISSIVSSVITLFTGFIFSIYMLSQKEYLQRGSKKLIYAYLKKEHADQLIKIASLSHVTFSKFISGQCVEAAILGCIFFVVLSIFQFPYALIISVLTGVTALIPIFGAIFSMIVGTLLIAITDPLQAILFIIVFQVIQQLEENFIYPRIVGKSVGLSAMWTLLAISVGGSLYGIVGMLIGLPIASIVYALMKSDVNKRLNQKKISL